MKVKIAIAIVLIPPPLVCYAAKKKAKSKVSIKTILNIFCGESKIKIKNTHDQAFTCFHNAHNCSFNFVLSVLVHFVSGFLPLGLGFALGSDCLNFHSAREHIKSNKYIKPSTKEKESLLPVQFTGETVVDGEMMRRLNFFRAWMFE